MLVVIDNYDSFTYNLVNYFTTLQQQVRVFYHDKISITELRELQPDYIVISPGPGNPQQAGISLEVVRHFAGQVPILGVCLGHQVIAQAFGANIILATQVMHGKTSMVQHNGQGVFRGLPQSMRVTRYHSLLVDKDSLSADFHVTAYSEMADGSQQEVMGIQHVNFALHGVQFHPESVLTDSGMQLLRNFLDGK